MWQLLVTLASSHETGAASAVSDSGAAPLMSVVREDDGFRRQEAALSEGRDIRHETVRQTGPSSLQRSRREPLQ